MSNEQLSKSSMKRHPGVQWRGRSGLVGLDQYCAQQYVEEARTFKISRARSKPRFCIATATSTNLGTYSSAYMMITRVTHMGIDERASVEAPRTVRTLDVWAMIFAWVTQ